MSSFADFPNGLMFASNKALKHPFSMESMIEFNISSFTISYSNGCSMLNIAQTAAGCIDSGARLIFNTDNPTN